MEKQQFQNILFIRFRGIGDVLLTTPTVRAFRKAYPQARIAYLTEIESAAVLQANPDIDVVLVYPRDKTKKVSVFKKITGVLFLLRFFLCNRFDLSVDFRGDVKSVLFGLLCKAKVRVGFEYRVRKLFYTRVIKNSLFPPRLPAIQFYLKVAESFGIKTAKAQVVFEVSEQAQQKVRELLLQKTGGTAEAFIGINPGGTHPSKLWPLEKFVQTARAIEKKYKAVPIFFAGPYEQEQASRLNAFLAGSKGIIVRPQSLQELGALLQQCRLFLSNDSGPLHLAEAIKVSTVAIFGGSDPVVWFPYGPKDKCYVAGGFPRDIGTVTVKEVMRGVEAVLRHSRLAR